MVRSWTFFNFQDPLHLQEPEGKGKNKVKSSPLNLHRLIFQQLHHPFLCKPLFNMQ